MPPPPPRSRAGASDAPEIDVGPLRYHPGDRIGDKYQLEALLGQGGMGTVWRAKNLALGVEVAIKLLHVEQASPESTARLEREAHATARLEHPSAVRVFDLGHTVFGDPFIVMELLRGQSLRDVLEQRDRLSPQNAVPLVLPIASALVAAHGKGIVHRDLKPENVVLVETEAGGMVPKVVDFGIAKVESSTQGSRRKTREGTIMGSPDYMSPEQARGDVGRIDARADIWSLGVLLYELLAGRPPFDGDNHLALLRSIIEDPAPSLASLGVADAELSAVVERAMAKDPDARYPDMRSFGRELAEWALAQGIDTDVTGTTIAVHWGRAAHPSLSDAPGPPRITRDAPRAERSSRTITAIERASDAGGSRRWILLVGAVATFAGVAGTLLLLPRGDRAHDEPSTAAGSVRPADVEPLPSTIASTRPLASAPLAASAALTASVSTSASAPSATAVSEPPPPAPSDPAACMIAAFPEDTFEAGAPLGALCTERDARRAVKLLHTEIARHGTLQGRTTEAMREWALLSWYELAVLAGARGACCPADAPSLDLPPPVGTCPDIEPSLVELATAVRRGSPIAPALDALRLSFRCMGSARRANPSMATPYPYVDSGEGGAESAAKRMLERMKRR